MNPARRTTLKSLLGCTAAATLLCAAPAVASATTPTPAATKRPDIVLFIADDLSREDVGAYGSPDARTPNIDRLAAEGTKFANAFAASPTCTPSRSSLYTGQYPIRHGAHANHSPVKPGTKTLPHRLQALGYRVVLAGKTHIGERSDFPFEQLPASVVPPPEGRGVLWSKLNLAAVDELLATRDRDRPLALIVAAFTPHVPWHDDGTYDPGRLSVPPYLIDTPELRKGRAAYLTRVTELDSELGRLRRSLGRHGDPENTLFLFFADQGAQFPFAKWNLYDAGIATPFIAAWPGRIPSGRTTGAMVSLVDVLPTLQAAAGGTPATDVDGRNFLPVLRGETDRFHEEVFAAHSGTAGPPGRDANFAPMRAIRTADYKLIVNYRPDIRYENPASRPGPDNVSYWPSWVERAKIDPQAAATVKRFHHRAPVEFYDLREDRYELRNLADDPNHRARIAEMRRRLDRWISQQGEDPARVVMPDEANRGRFPYAQ